MIRTPPDELIEELRDSAVMSSLLTDGEIPVVDQIEWEAADWILVCCELLERVKAAGGDMGLSAAELLHGDYQRTKQDGSPTMLDQP